MKLKQFVLTAGTLAALAAAPAHAQVEIQWWHSMSGQLGEWIGGLAKGFNDSQKTYKWRPSAPATPRTSCRSSKWARPA